MKEKRKLSIQMVVFIFIMLFALMGESVFEHYTKSPFERHQERFERYMQKHQIPYTDMGCEYGWLMTDRNKSRKIKRANKHIYDMLKNQK